MAGKPRSQAASTKKQQEDAVLDVATVDEKLAGGLVAKADESPETPPQFQPAGGSVPEPAPKVDESPIATATEDGVLTVDLARLAADHPNSRSTTGAYVTKLFRRFDHDPGRVLHELKRTGGWER